MLSSERKMYCAISGEVPLEPVVSRVSGHVFDRRLIDKALENSKGICPKTGNPLEKSDLIQVKADLAIRPRPTTATSLPGMLAMFQNEWDDVMLETHVMKQQLHATRKELTHALYQHDAACRVIQRLTQERDEARAKVDELEQTLATQTAELSMKRRRDDETKDAELDDEPEPQRQRIDEEELPAAVDDTLTAYWKEASKKRMKRSTPSNLASKPDLQRFTKRSAVEIFQENATALTVLPSRHVVVGSATGDLAFVSPTASDINARTTTQQGKILSLSPYMQKKSEDDGDDVSYVVACSSDEAAVWRLSSSSSSSSGEEIIDRVCVLTGPSTPLGGAAAHPAGVEYAVVNNANADWALCDLTGAALMLANGTGMERATAPVEIHPDGLIIAIPVQTQDQTLIRIYNVKDRSNAHSFDAHDAPVTKVAFSENGYYMASSSDDMTVRIFDLRKLAQLHRIDLAFPVSTLAFDFSGKYLVYSAGTTLKIDVVKEWTNLATLDTSDTVSSLDFGPDAAYVAAATSNGILDLFSLPPPEDATTT